MPDWRYIEEDDVAADYGLAADEYLRSAATGTLGGPALRLYTYRSHCALAGRFQNIQAEIDLEYCRRAGIAVGRRPTGGGAIIMGKGQLGVCFTAPASYSLIADCGQLPPGEIYRVLSRPIVSALARLGITASFGGRNDLEVDGQKIAGLGVCYDAAGSMLFHASVLVDLDVDLMLKVLKVPAQKIHGKARVGAVEERITTASRLLGAPVSTDEVRGHLRQAYEDAFDISLRPRDFSSAEREEIETLAATKYRTEDWLYQRTPQRDMTGMSVVRTPAGVLRTYVGLMGNTIKSVLITGDFFESAGVFNQFETRLKWSPMDRKAIAAAAADVLQEDSGLGIEPRHLVRAVWQAGQRALREDGHTYDGSCYYPDSKGTPESVADPQTHSHA